MVFPSVRWVNFKDSVPKSRARTAYRRNITETNLAHQDAMNDIRTALHNQLTALLAGAALGVGIVGLIVGLSEIVGMGVG